MRGEGAPGALGSMCDGLQGPWEAGVTGGGPTGAVGGRGDGRRGYRVRWEVG